jgi:hypothetical protein
MRRTYVLACLLLCSLTLTAQDTATKKLVLIGNTHGSTKLLRLIRNNMNMDSGAAFLFLGNDMTDMRGTPVDATDSFLSVFGNTGAKAIFLPGKEEWQHNLTQFRKEKKYIRNEFADTGKILLPRPGCPGPEEIDLGNDARLVIMDSQWWLEGDKKPGMESDCPCKNEQQVKNKLDDIIADNSDKLLLFATHHPFRTTGIRSGYFGPRQHLFPLTDIRGMQHAYVPLPVAGSLYPIVRGVAIGRQDMAHSAYAHMISNVDQVLAEHPFLIHIGGHEHVLELYDQQGQYYITSGAGDYAGRTVKTRHALFAGRHEGFALLEISGNKKARVAFYELIGGRLRCSFQKELLDFSKRPPMVPAEQATPVAQAGDSVTAAIYAKYGRASGMKRLLLGNNYRSEWSTPVTMRVLHLQEDPRHFRITGQGGGKQTTSIRLKDETGKVWSLRTIVKDPEKVLPPQLRETVAEDVLKDLTSAAHPFAPLISSRLEASTGIIYPKEEYYYMPDDTALGYFRPAFANTIAALEERQPSRYGEETKSTWHVVNEHLEKWEHRVDAYSYLQARLMDVLLADFDRHYEQWKWGETPGSNDSGKTWYAIPKDRDQAFFNCDGLLIRLGANKGMSYLKGMKRDIANINSLGFVSRDIDAFFLNELTAADWQREIHSFTATLTDSAIHASVAAMPPPAYAAHGAWIEGRLRSRRDALYRRGMIFYRFLAARVNIVGSNRRETFLADRCDSGISVSVTSAQGETKYRRIFSLEDTREICLYGFGGDDTFRIMPGVPHGICFRIIGGAGNDVFDIAGNARTFVYDDAGENNTLLRHHHTTNMISHRDDVNSYAFRENHYTDITYPTIVLGYNIDDGIMAGLGARITKRGFRADPFTTQHHLSTLIAFQYRAYQARYTGTFNDAWRHFDVLANAAVLHPALQNFFGLGNETKRDTALPLKFYRVRYSYATADLMLRKRAIHNKLSIALGPSLFYYWNNNDRNTGRILNYASDYGLDSSRIFSPKFYAGGKLTADFNSIDNPLLPTRGIRFRLEGLGQTGLNEQTLPYFRAQSDLTIYSPLSDNKRFILTLRGGGGHIFSDSFEYWQALTLGANNYLRGYRKSRFSGSGMAYGSAELRWRLTRFRTRILPAEFGLVGFQDVGRVWLRGEDSDKWHLSYGGGIYFTPFNAVLISILGAKSDEEQITNISIGAGLNIVF